MKIPSFASFVVENVATAWTQVPLLYVRIIPKYKIFFLLSWFAEVPLQKRWLICSSSTPPCTSPPGQIVHLTIPKPITPNVNKSNILFSTPLLPPSHISPFTKCKLCVRPSPQLMPSLKVIYTRAVIYIWQLAVNYTTVMCLIITGRSLPLQEVGPRINHKQSRLQKCLIKILMTRLNYFLESAANQSNFRNKCF